MKMTFNVIEHELQNGNKIEIMITEYCNRAMAKFEYGGRTYSGNPIAPKNQAPAIVARYTTMGIDGAYQLGILGLPVKKAMEVQNAIDALQEEINNRPEVKTEKLIEARNELTLTIAAYYEAAQEAKNTSYESGEGTGEFVNAGKKHEEKAEQVKTELREFDLNNSEILEIIKKRKHKTAVAHMWD